MQPPGFWSNSPAAPGLAARLLSPLGLLYAAGTAHRLTRAGGYEAACPVICVGNINAGGTGKTPTVISLTERIGAGVHVVSRGYGGALAGPVQVDPERHGAGDVGDEPLLLAAFAPTWVAKDRAAGVKAAEQAGAQAIILDDGHQNPSVRKDAAIIVADAQTGFGNGLCIPAGPLREPVGAGLARGDLLVTIGNASAQERFSELWGSATAGIDRVTARLEPLKTGMPWEGIRVLAFAGIGRPEKFFATLRELGAEVVRGEALDDHQVLGPRLLERLQSDAWQSGAQLVTTEKDAVRLPAAFRPQVLTLPVRLTFDAAAPLDAILAGLGRG